MPSTHSGAFRLFRFAGVDVYLHWTWFLAAWYFIGLRGSAYSSLAWNIAEYIALFVIVLMHEFGHALAARQVGGESREIILWPFGGIAFAKVPPRPGAEAWAVAAGPLVNVVLLPVLWGVLWLAGTQGWAEARPELADFLSQIFVINIVLLVFNVLPIYPLDGGQFLRALLWFKLGRARSLQIATIIGFIGIAGSGAPGDRQPVHLLGYDRPLPRDGVPPRFQTSSSPQETRPAPASLRFRVPDLRRTPPRRPTLALLELQQRLRPVFHPRGLPALRQRAPESHVRALRLRAPPRTLGGRAASPPRRSAGDRGLRRSHYLSCAAARHIPPAAVANTSSEQRPWLPRRSLSFISIP